MTTQTRPDVDLLESLDFEPVCQDFRGCDSVATWLAWSACGCVAVYFCEVHRAVERFNIARLVKPACLKCGKPVDVIWRRL